MLLSLLAFAFGQEVEVAVQVEAAIRSVEAAERPPAPLKVSILPGLGFAAASDRPVDGIAVGFVTRSPRVEGLDASLVTVVDGTIEGGQFGIITVSKGGVQGGQAAAGLSIAKGFSRGLAVSGGIAVAESWQGVVAAPMTVVSELDGVQMGMLNVGGSGKGAMVGFVNVAKSLDGPAIGLVNIIGDGMFHVDTWVSESALLSGAVKFGSKTTYTLIGAGWVRPDGPWWTAGWGLGVHLPARFVFVESDITAWMVAEGSLVLPGVHGKLRAQLGLPLAKRFSPFAGASLNGWWGSGDAWPLLVGLPSSDRQHRVVFWPGLHAGIQW